MPGENVLVIDDSPTILKVVELALTKAGYLVHTALDGEDGVARARQLRPDLVLLDFVMPKMNGFEVCQTLAGDPRLAHVPILLMSAKGEEVGEHFLKMPSVADTITKPFSPEAMLAVVAHTIEKRAASRAADAIPILTPSDGTERIEPAATTITPKTPPPEAVEADLTGNLAVIPVAEIFSLLQEQSQTGVLSARQGDARVEVAFRGGRVDFAAAVGVAEEFLLGRFLVESGEISKAVLAAVVEDRAKAGSGPDAGLLGTDLLRRGLLSASGLRKAAARQTAELCYELLRWGAGTVVFKAAEELPAPAQEVRLGLAVDNLLMEGFRRVDEWRLIEREIESFDLVFVRNEEKIATMGRGELTREELAVLELVNGKSSVRDLIRLSRMGSFDATKMLYRLLRIKLIRRRVMPMAV